MLMGQMPTAGCGSKSGFKLLRLGRILYPLFQITINLGPWKYKRTNFLKPRLNYSEYESFAPWASHNIFFRTVEFKMAAESVRSSIEWYLFVEGK